MAVAEYAAAEIVRAALGNGEASRIPGKCFGCGDGVWWGAFRVRARTCAIRRRRRTIDAGDGEDIPPPFPTCRPTRATVVASRIGKLSTLSERQLSPEENDVLCRPVTAAIVLEHRALERA